MQDHMTNIRERLNQILDVYEIGGCTIDEALLEAVKIGMDTATTIYRTETKTEEASV